MQELKEKLLAAGLRLTEADFAFVWGTLCVANKWGLVDWLAENAKDYECLYSGIQDGFDVGTSVRNYCRVFISHKGTTK